MNKATLCLLVFLCFLSFSMTPVEAHPITTLAHQVRSSVLDWMTNQNDWFLATQTAAYCFNLGWFNVFNYNDGGLAFYTCLDSYFKTIRFL